jgi:RNA polymerase sigma-70 factor (ECF subfamily)
MTTVVPGGALLLPDVGNPAVDAAVTPDFDAIYDDHFDFVWRSLRRLGVPEAGVDDALQDVFVVVHRRLADFDGASPRAWLFRIAFNVVREHRRTYQRKGRHEELPESIADAAPGPHEALARAEALRLVEHLLDALDEDRRAVFILAEYEEMTAPEMAAALGVNVNTVSSRLRAARRDFEAALARHRSRTR